MYKKRTFNVKIVNSDAIYHTLIPKNSSEFTNMLWK